MLLDTSTSPLGSTKPEPADPGNSGHQVRRPHAPTAARSNDSTPLSRFISETEGIKLFNIDDPQSVRSLSTRASIHPRQRPAYTGARRVEGL